VPVITPVDELIVIPAGRPAWVHVNEDNLPPTVLNVDGITRLSPAVPTVDDWLPGFVSTTAAPDSSIRADPAPPGPPVTSFAFAKPPDPPPVLVNDAVPPIPVFTQDEPAPPPPPAPSPLFW